MTAAAWLRAKGKLEDWFLSRKLRSARFQRDAWRAWRDGHSGLIHAPTGSGKTLAALGGPLLDALSRPEQRGLQLLWITPLRALASDTASNLTAPIEALGLPWRVLRKTGDSSSGERAKLKRGAAEVLITTPESLSLLLSYPDAAEKLADLRAVVVDEWHELIGSKRGVQLELALARVRKLAPAVRVWGLSATLGNLGQAMDTLLGPHHAGQLISAPVSKQIVVSCALPDGDERFPWAGHLGLRQLARVMRAVSEAESTLVFTNTRSQAELWHEALAAVWPFPAEQLGLHHGSLDRGLRREVEDGLRAGTMRCVVATSSLDLGVDFGSVERIVQIGSPKGVARLAQRAGRSGHRPGVASQILMVPTQLMELAEIAGLRRSLRAGLLEPRTPLRLSLDVLAQHLVTLALGGGFDADPAFAEVRTTHAFAELARADFSAVLDFITLGGRALSHYPDYHKVVLEGSQYRVVQARVARLHRLSIGTIASDGSLEVRLMKGRRLGNIEEAFVSRLTPGESFLFAGRALELIRIKDMTAWVRLASGKRGSVPRWMGSRMPLSNELASQMQIALADRAPSEPELKRLAPLLALQRRVSAVPEPDQLLVEIVRARDGEHLFLYPFAGRLAHEGLAAVLATRLSRLRAGEYSFAMSDYGVVISATRLPALDEQAIARLLSTEQLDADIRASINLTEMARRQFREVARVAGLVFSGFPGQNKSLRQVQASSGLIFDVLTEHDPEHMLLHQAQRDVLERELDLPRLQRCLQAAQNAQVCLTRPKRLTPFGFALWAERFRGGLNNEDWSTRVARLAAELEARAQ